MSPRNERYQVPKHIVQGIRDKRKALLHGPFACPNCGREKLMIKLEKGRNVAGAVCVCGVEQELKFVPVYEAVDYYSKFMDSFRRGKK